MNINPGPNSKNTVRLAQSALSLARDLKKSPSSIVAAALQSFDQERVSSIPSMIQAFHDKVNAISNDRELSDEGKRTRIRSLADSQMGNLATAAKKIVALEAQHREEKATAIQMPKAEAADVVLDLALVQHVKQVDPIPTKLLQMSERIRLAVARTPVELSGLTQDVHSKVYGSLISPEKAVQFGEEEQSLSMARNVAQAAIYELGPQAEWSPRDLVQSFGTEWKLPGVFSPEVVQRMHPANAGEA